MGGATSLYHTAVDKRVRAGIGFDPYAKCMVKFAGEGVMKTDVPVLCCFSDKFLDLKVPGD
jgi:hypothetical protein